MTPSERAADLMLNVRRIRTETGLKVVPMLVVEGESDESAFGDLVSHGHKQIFPAGTRQLVEQLLRHFSKEQPSDFVCIYLVDCDGVGKTADLAEDPSLIVTETCDIEADLINLGIVQRTIRPFCDSDPHAEAFVARACEIGMPLSTVRRAAHSVSVSMKKHQRPFRLPALPELHLAAWEAEPPKPGDVADLLASELEWTTADAARVKAAIGSVSDDFTCTCLGKDVLDALYRLMQREGHGEIRGWTHRFFFRALFAELQHDDLGTWEVGRRVRSWEERSGHKLLLQRS